MIIPKATPQIGINELLLGSNNNKRMYDESCTTFILSRCDGHQRRWLVESFPWETKKRSQRHVASNSPMKAVVVVMDRNRPLVGSIWQLVLYGRYGSACGFGFSVVFTMSFVVRTIISLMEYFSVSAFCKLCIKSCFEAITQKQIKVLALRGEKIFMQQD